MPVGNIDYNRGCMKKLTPEGVAVFMYFDDPGIFLSLHGTPVTDELAARADFDVATYKKQRLRNERMAAAKQAVDEQIDLEDRQGRNLVVEVRDGFSLVDIGLGRYVVKDPEGTVLTPQPISKEIAKGLLNGLTGGAGPKNAKEVAPPLPTPKSPPAGSAGPGRATEIAPLG